MNLTTARKRLRAWVDLLTANQIAKGKTWYADAHVFALESNQICFSSD